MARPRTRIDAVCQNKTCRYYQKTKGKDIVRRGFNSAGTQMYKCLNCNKYFVETSGTPLYRKRLPKTKIEQLCRALVEKNGVRATARLTQLTTTTVSRWHDDMAQHAQQINAYLTHDLNLGEYEVDEFWSTVKKNRKNIAQNMSLPREKAKHGATPASSATPTFSPGLRSVHGRKKPAHAS